MHRQEAPPAPGHGDAGDLAIVLHSHMPYVEGFGTYPFGEEWLFDAVLRSYVPVMEVADRLTVSVTPVLADQLEAPGIGPRLERFARAHRLDAARADAIDMASDGCVREACEFAAARYERALEVVRARGEDLLGLFRVPAEQGRIELATSAATHAVLPLLASREGRRLQIDAGLRSHRRRFAGGRGDAAPGFWLPECAYSPGLEGLLAERGVPWFCVDQSGHEEGPEALAPVATATGPVAFPIDWGAILWLWSFEGYPSDPSHLDFRNESLRGTRAWTVTGAPYRPEEAAGAARRQAREFLDALAMRLRTFEERCGRRGVCVFAVDTELLGHWWTEGPAWLAEVIRSAPEAGVRMVTMSEARAEHAAKSRPLRASSWGEGKDLRTWDSADVADMTRAARRLELRLLRSVPDPTVPVTGKLRAARELLALQGSDWAFLDKRRQAGDYPWQRASGHGERLLEALAGESGPPDPRLRSLAPDLDLAPLLEP